MPQDLKINVIISTDERGTPVYQLMDKHLMNSSTHYNKNLSQKTRNRGILPQFNKEHLQETYKLTYFYKMWCACVLSHVRLFATPWVVAHQAPLSLRFPREEYWNGLLFPSPGDLPDLKITLTWFALPASAGGFFTTSATWEAPYTR